MRAWDGRKFAILMPWGRVGSNLVVAVLSEQGGVPIANEPTTAQRSRVAAAPGQEFKIDLAQTLYLRQFPASARFSTGFGRLHVAGVKLAHRSFVSPLATYQILRDEGFRVVTMDRENHLKSAVSQIRADQRRADPKHGTWAIRSGAGKPGPSIIPPKLVISRTRAFAIQSQLMHGYADSFFANNCLKVVYEDLAKNPVGEIRRTADYLGVGLPDHIELPFEKATSDDLRDDVSNYDEVSAVIRETEFASFLE